MNGSRYDHACLVGVVFWLVVWSLLFWRSPRHRRAMLLTSMALGLAGALAEPLTWADHWRPAFSLPISIGSFPFAVEGAVLMFALGGICATVFERAATLTGHAPLPPVTIATLGWLTAWMTAAGALTFAMSVALRIYSVTAFVVAGVVMGLVILSRHGRLPTMAAMLAIACGAVYWLFYVLVFVPVFPGCFDAMWKLENSWGVKLGGVPRRRLDVDALEAQPREQRHVVSPYLAATASISFDRPGVE
jgi:hypothetical protein